MKCIKSIQSRITLRNVKALARGVGYNGSHNMLKCQISLLLLSVLVNSFYLQHLEISRVASSLRNESSAPESSLW